MDVNGEDGNLSPVPQPSVPQLSPLAEPPTDVSGDLADSLDDHHLPVEVRMDTEVVLDDLPGPVEITAETDDLLDTLPDHVEETRIDDDLQRGDKPVEAAEGPEWPGTEELPTEAVTHFETDPVEVATPLRRSQRSWERPQRLQYDRLGNPLISVAQTLVQNLCLLILMP